MHSICISRPCVYTNIFIYETLSVLSFFLNTEIKYEINSVHKAKIMTKAWMKRHYQRNVIQYDIQFEKQLLIKVLTLSPI